MGNYEQLKQAVLNAIKTNGTQAITGQVLQNTLISIINSLGANAQFAGIATPSTNPGTPDQNIFYLATEAGIYVNFSSIKVNDGEVVILEYRGTWVKKVTGLAIASKISEIERISAENKLFIDSIIGGEKTLQSVYDLRYTNTSSTIEDGYSYSKIDGGLASIPIRIPLKLNTGNGFPTSGSYHVFAKIRLTIQNPNDDLKGIVQYGVLSDKNITLDFSNNVDVAIGEFKTLYLGKITVLAKPTYVFLAQILLKTLAGGNPGGTNLVKLEYYGGYLIEDSVIGANDVNEIANNLDYTKQETTLTLTGWKSEVEADLKNLSNEDDILKERIDNIEDGISSVNKSFLTVKSSYDVRKDMFTESSGVTDEGDFLRATIKAPTYLRSFATKYFKTEAGKYSTFAKLKISTEEGYNTSDKFACVYLKRGGGGDSSNKGKFNIPLNQLVNVYLGDSNDAGINTYFYISLEYIRDINNQNQTNLGTITFDFYGAYYVKESEVSDTKEFIAGFINYKELESKVILNSVFSKEAEKADKAKQADFASSSDLANNMNNIFRGSQLKIYGDSLVVYIPWNNLQSMFSVKGVMNGVGGIKVCNNDKKVNYGLCSLERIATFPRNMKLLVIYGGANDVTETESPTYDIDPAKLGDINDEPLKIADMLNYRVTADNISNTNTLGRAQTFYQGYKTMLRNIMALFPNCQIMCVTQHRYYYYVKADGGFSQTPILRRDAYAKVKAIREIAEEYSVPICDLWATSGVNDSNRRYTLIDAAGVLVHQTSATALKEESLIINKILEIAPKFEIPNYTTTKGEDIIEMKKWVVDVRDEVDCNVMTLEEAIAAFVQKTSSEAIDLKNNMLLPFYYNSAYASKVYILKDYTQPSLTASWKEWVGGKIDDSNEPKS